MLKGQGVLVIGAGIGGLASAIALAKRGANVRVVEQAPEITEVGAGLQISPNGVAVLDALGLGERAREMAIRSRSVVLRDFRLGALVLRVDLSKHSPDLTYLLFHRADLIDLLADGARDAGVQIELGRQVANLSEDEAGVSVEFADGSQEQHALVIGADGLHSGMRQLLNGKAAPDFTGQVAWRACVPTTDELMPEVTVHMGPGRHLITYPLRGGQLINIVAVEERTTWADEGWNHPGDPEELRHAFSSFSPQVNYLLERVEIVKLWGLFSHPVAQYWHRNHSALVGDAAHPTLPFLAQGANMALEDAWVLADCLANIDARYALPAYHKRRHARVKRVIAAANANARNYHLQNPVVRGAAHSLLRLGGAFAPAKVVGQFDWIYRHDVTRN